MFGDFGRDVFGNIFDDACTFLFSFVEFGAAVGTVGESVFDVFVDDGRCSSRAFMTGLGTGLFLAFFAGFFLIGGKGGGGSGGVRLAVVGGFEGECGELQQSKDYYGFALRIEGAGGIFIETVFQEGENIWFGSGGALHRTTLYTNKQNVQRAIFAKKTTLG